MAYEFPTLDTSQRQKFGTMLDLLAPTDRYYSQISGEGDKALQKAFAAAQQRIGQQFTPAFRMAQARLGGSPLLADSGYANRLNRQLQGAAFGDLSNAYGGAAADMAQRNQGYLAQLIQQRLGAAQGLLGQTQKKQNTTGSLIGSLVGAGLGAFAGPMIGAMGSQVGKNIVS